MVWQCCGTQAPTRMLIHRGPLSLLVEDATHSHCPCAHSTHPKPEPQHQCNAQVLCAVTFMVESQRPSGDKVQSLLQGCLRRGQQTPGGPGGARPSPFHPCFHQGGPGHKRSSLTRAPRAFPAQPHLVTGRITCGTTSPGDRKPHEAPDFPCLPGEAGLRPVCTWAPTGAQRHVHS